MQADGIQMGCKASDEFRIGDFVWGKIHGHLWWPGQVCNPSDASIEARNSEHLDHHVLVAYFGDITFAWCEPSELKPFKEEFEHLSHQNSSHGFISAVKDAMHEIENCLRSDLTCYCVPSEKIVQFRMSRNNGIGKSSIANYSPAAFLSHLQDVAQDVSVASMLDVTMLRSWAASFYLRNGCFFKMIEDLFDEKKTDLNALPENSYKDKRRGDSQITGGRVVKGPLNSCDEASRKKRSMAELILLADSEVEDKLGTVENETKGHINLGLLQNQKKKRKKEKQKPKVPVDKATKVMNDEENGTTRRERKKSKYLSPPYTTGFTERSNSLKSVDPDVSENDSESSQHMQAKFPEGSTNEGDPITHLLSNYNEASAHDILIKLFFVASNPLHLRRNFPLETVMEFFLMHRSLVYSGTLMLENFSEHHGDSGTFRNPPLLEMESNEASSGKKKNNQEDESNPEYALGRHENRGKVKKDQATTETTKSFCLNGVNASTGRSRYRGKRSADDALIGGVEKLNHITINYLGEDKIEEKRSKTAGIVNDGKARQTGNVHHVSSSHKRKSYDDLSNGQHQSEFSHFLYDNPRKSPIKSKRTKHAVSDNENSVALLLTFSPGITLPSKDELLSLFSKYGDLINHETELFRDPGCARVVFARASDAKKALTGIRNSKNFPFLVVDCQSFNLPQSTDSPSPSQSDSNASLLRISRDLQRMIDALSPKKGNTFHGLQPVVRKDLINDIKGLLNKVKKLIT
ncbi:uncharacterized protein LOC110036877 [Phalaenopsis equestris]|uniref:uncharacterized protein LOC110036877 n=1 Tax=Phalaenopsis equestris TaxID=78828 RepID=UPI0009E5B0E8|nr:uncharacterized protein LOC110036877 [Phalaenopsis equestris]